MLPVLEKYKAIVKDYRIIAFEEAGPSFKLRAVIVLVDSPQLYVRETLIGGEKRKYAYHWQASDGHMLVRWDNAPDWDIETFPHHKHVADQGNVTASYERSLGQGLSVIADVLRLRNMA